MSVQYDFLIIGEDEASLCAAACAARAGARAALLRPNRQKKQNAPAASPAIPNFVWRRLELQDYDLTLEPISAHVTLFKDGSSMVTYAGSKETGQALAERNIDDHLVWDDFIDEVSSLAEENLSTLPFARANPANGKVLASFLSDATALDRTARLFGSCADLIDDYLSSQTLKTHISAHALAAAGSSDLETGSASAVSEFFDEHSWRLRTPKDAASLRAVLEKVCQDAGVDIHSGKITEIASEGENYVLVMLGAEEELKTRTIFFSTPDAAWQAGAHGSVLNSTSGGAHASVTVRFKLSDRIPPAAADDKAIFQIVDDIDDVRDARAAAVKGKLFDKTPVEFEYTANGEIIARTNYFPAAFYEDGAWRGWTGQDRQAAAAIVKSRLISRMPDLASQIRRAEAEVITPTTKPGLFDDCDKVVIQMRRHNSIAAAVKLIDEIMARDAK
ncbi:hypothetical protein PUV54_02880 [Hyphococcus flavus]|uniref:Uncharacterized protein n=1 Tax=Hyphococcus flavus TaxID=1866326 RepID=A0AAE9ZEA1_9PROT|nr:hypothetical protein [Hyphococcus flavus]WDI32135.1 hypothetical protein PUV54_02880 [Hyphococcus flavus]